MADPDHVTDLDEFDASTVRLYRASLAVGAVSLLLAGTAYLTGGIGSGEVRQIALSWLPMIWTLLVYATGAAVMNLHLYARRIRWAIHGLAWAGVIVLLASHAVAGEDLSFWLERAGIGLLFATWSGIALKEQFCFRLPLMQAVPWFLAASLVPLCADAWLPTGLLLFASGALLTLLASKKQRQPLHYDIGDKARYEV